ncbi:Cytochrome P450 71A1 [Platanthera guangdongensis]|uniref:Cytochrome P450 71A1 n=1 Tax=Platanthera guangdongensis TaxID=2320717 RepID=A0ABR2MRR3_9ASPA
MIVEHEHYKLSIKRRFSGKVEKMANESLRFLQSLMDALNYNGPPSIPLLFPLLLFLCTLLYLVSRKHGHMKNLPPTPGLSIPLFGHLHLLGSSPHVSLHRLSQKHGPLIRLNLGLVPTIVASSPETAAKILKNYDTHFCSRPSLTPTSRYSYGDLDIAFSPYNQHWMKLRRFSNAHIFSPSRVHSLRAIREQEVEAMVNAISNKYATSVNVSDAVMCLFNNITFREVFGKQPERGDYAECGMRSPYHELISEVIFLMGVFFLEDLSPYLAWVDVVRGWRGKLERSFQALDAMLEQEIAERMKKRERQEAGTSEKDDATCFLDVLLQHISDDDQNGKNDSAGLQLNIVEAKALLVNMFIGGTDTSASVLDWAMTDLMRNPEAMRKAQEEVRQVVGHKGSVEETDIHRLHYLKMVIKETLRLHPPAPLLIQRECLKDTTIDGYRIPAKARILINAWAIGRDPNYWDNPESFRPERFEGSAISYMGNHFQLIPFGGGRRICPGMGLGIVGVELAMASLLYSFNWDLPPGMSRGDVSMEEGFGIVRHRKVPLLLVPGIRAA